MFDVTKPLVPIFSSDFIFTPGETPGKVLSQVFEGIATGPDAGYYAYLYQVNAPSQNDVWSFKIPNVESVGGTIDDLKGKTQKDVTSILITMGVGPGKDAIGGFTTPRNRAVPVQHRSWTD